MVRAKNTSQKCFKFLFMKMTHREIMKTRLFGQSLEPWDPRDRTWIQERKILFRIALTRALYDQMAPQLCYFYVPRQPIISCVSPARREIIITTNQRFWWQEPPGKTIFVLFCFDTRRDEEKETQNINVVGITKSNL